MNIQWIGRHLVTGPAAGPLLTLATNLLYRDKVRAPLMGIADWRLRARVNRVPQVPSAWYRIEKERTLVARAILHTVDRLIERRALSPHVVRVIMDLWGRVLFVPQGAQPVVQRFREEYGCDPPWFITVSPGHACTLQCSGCYAGAEPSTAKLPWSVLDRIISEAKELWGIPLVVISGGEPLEYRSEGKDVLDAVERHADTLFLMFTNGTTIDAQTAERLARLGNLTPAISVEGMRRRTDEHRGQGTFDRVLEAMDNLRHAGVPFGISVTATSLNCEEILSDEFLDFFFYGQGAFYGFLFHYMPIGRSVSFEWMPTPEQRLDCWRRSWEVVASKKIFLFDFWNHGTMVQGCVSAGRDGGYLYIDWTGKVMPCVFAPYSAGNIQEIYRQGGTLNDVWNAPFFQTIRRWQREYGFGKPEPRNEGNWLRPCPIRDHYPLFRKWLESYHPDPEDEAAGEAMADEHYYERLMAYGDRLAELSQGIWERDYLCHKGFDGPRFPDNPLHP